MSNDKLSGSVLRSEAEQNRIRWSVWLAHSFILLAVSHLPAPKVSATL